MEFKKIFKSNSTRQIEQLQKEISELKTVNSNKRAVMPSFISNALSYNSSSNFNTSKSLELSAVYRCVNLISSTIASLKLELFEVKDGYQYRVDNTLSNLLSHEPHPKMGAYNFFSLIVQQMLLKGNAFVFINRDTANNIIDLQLLNTDNVTINAENTYSVLGYPKPINARNIINICNYSIDGVNGISTISYAAKALELAYNAEMQANGFFKGGANLAGIVKVDGALQDGQAEEIRASWQQAFNAQTGNPNGVAILEGNMNFQAVQISPVDAQLIETRKFSVIDICRFFSVHPVKAFDTQAATYSNIESTQLQFLSDCIAPLLRKIENEFERKLFLPSEIGKYNLVFNLDNLLRTDSVTTADYYTKMVQLGVYTPNEVRKKLNLQPIEGGDNAYIMSNLMSLAKPNTEQINNINK